jgi:hypothetical protein
LLIFTHLFFMHNPCQMHKMHEHIDNKEIRPSPPQNLF